MSEIPVRPLAGSSHGSGRKLGRVEWARLLVVENGVRWTAYAGLLGGLRKASSLVSERMTRLERGKALSGRTGRAVNYEYWQRWDWSSRGEEWTLSEDWKRALIDDVMRRHMKPATTILEIGPGAGRWTEALQTIAGRLIVVDLSDRCIELCRRRFAGASNIEYHVNDGRSLDALAANSVDGVWSFDVFVHIAAPDIDAYVKEIGRVLRPGGRAVIHHAGAGGARDAADVGMRSNMTAGQFAAMVQKHGLTLAEQFDSWGPDGRFQVPWKWDIVSVFDK